MKIVAASRIPRLWSRLLATRSNCLNKTRSLEDLSLARSSQQDIFVCWFRVLGFHLHPSPSCHLCLPSPVSLIS